MVARKNTEYVIGQGVMLKCKMINKLGMELFALIITNPIGTDKIIGTFMSEELAITKLEYLLHHWSAEKIIAKYLKGG